MKSEGHISFVYHTLVNMIPSENKEKEHIAKISCNVLAYVLEIDPPYEDLWIPQTSGESENNVS